MKYGDSKTTTFSPRFSHVLKAYSGLDLFFAAIPYLSDFHKKQFWGLKTGFGALVQGHPFAWVHISLGSTVLPKPPPKSNFGGLKLILGHL